MTILRDHARLWSREKLVLAKTSRSGLRRAGGWTVVVFLVCKKSLRKPKMIILFMDVYKVGFTVGGFGL